uniref:Uncharacterized protein n=1 Tax=Leersia perrieri TaxID=77586 RepID=A0A0D9XVE2_9ORYZ
MLPIELTATNSSTSIPDGSRVVLVLVNAVFDVVGQLVNLLHPALPYHASIIGMVIQFPGVLVAMENGDYFLKILLDEWPKLLLLLCTRPSMESTAASAFLKALKKRLFMELENNTEPCPGKPLAAARPPHDSHRHGRPALNFRNKQHLCPHGQTAVAWQHTEEMLDLARDIEDCLTCKHNLTSARASLVRRVMHKLKKVKSCSSFADEIQKL